MSNGGRDKGRCVSIFILVNFLNNYGTSMQPDIYKSKIICDSFFFFFNVMWKMLFKCDLHCTWRNTKYPWILDNVKSLKMKKRKENHNNPTPPTPPPPPKKKKKPLWREIKLNCYSRNKTGHRNPIIILVGLGFLSNKCRHMLDVTISLDPKRI